MDPTEIENENDDTDARAEAATAAIARHVNECSACVTSPDGESIALCPIGTDLHIEMLEANDWTDIEGNSVRSLAAVP